MSRLCVVSEGQKGRHVPDDPSYSHTVQHDCQPSHRITALPAQRYNRQSHLNLPTFQYARSTSPHYREVDPSSTGQFSSSIVWKRSKYMFTLFIMDLIGPLFTNYTQNLEPGVLFTTGYQVFSSSPALTITRPPPVSPKSGTQDGANPEPNN